MRLIQSQDQGSPVYQVALAGRGPFALSSSAATGDVFAWERDAPGRLAPLGRFGWDGERLRNRRPPDPADLYETRGDRLVHRVVHFVFHPDGHHVAVVGPDRPVALRSLPAASVLRSFGDAGQFNSVCFTESGKHLAAAGWITLQRGRDSVGRLSVFDTDSGNWLGSAVGPGSAVTAHPEGTLLAAVSNGQGMARIQIFGAGPAGVVRYDRGAELYTELDGLSFSPDGSALAAVGDEDYFTIHVLDFPSCRVRFRKFLDYPPGYVRRFRLPKRCAFTADGGRLLCPYPTGDVAELDARSGRELRRWPAHDGPVHSLDVRHDESLLLTGGLDGHVKLWQLDDAPRQGPDVSAAPVTRQFLTEASVLPDDGTVRYVVDDYEGEDAVQTE
jgi:WD40 repeat protein